MSTPVMISGDSDRSILFVHGTNFKPSPGQYLDILSATLMAGLENDFPEIMLSAGATRRVLAYYGDLSNELLRSYGQTYDEQLDLSDMQNALHELRGLDRKKGFGINRYDRLPGKSALNEFAASVLAPVLSAVGLEKALVTSASKDLGEYWRQESEIGRAMLTRVRDCIREAIDARQRILIISHGTGAILTWDALWELSHDPDHRPSSGDAKIDLWLTLGAPLGDKTVQKQLRGSARKGRDRFPTNIVAWHNVSAEDDFVSHDNSVADDFRDMLRQHQISSIRDYRIYNMAIRYGVSTPHSMLGYLIHPRAAKIVNDWLVRCSESVTNSPLF